MKQEQKNKKEKEKELTERKKIANLAISQYQPLETNLAAEMAKVTFPHVPPIVRGPCESHKQALTNYLNEANCVIRLGGAMDASGLGTAADIKAFAAKAKKALVLLVAVNSSLARTGGI